MVTAVNFSATVQSGARVIACGRNVAGFAGRLIQDPNYPQSLIAGGVNKYFCGPGDPEGFFYLGTKQGDGTRSGGAQQDIINNMRAGFPLYCIAVRQPGDGASDETPFVGDTYGNSLVQAILDQWEGWLTQLEAIGVIVLFHIFDDHDTADPGFGTGDSSPAAEQTFVQALVNEFEHHRNIIFIVGEEANEGFSNARVSAIGSAMRSANDEILIGSHQESGVVFNHQTDSNVRLFAIQNNDRTVTQNHSDIAGIDSDAQTDGYLYAPTEAGSTGATGATARQLDWAWFTGGACGSCRYQQRADTMPESDKDDCTRLISFVESTPFQTMRPNDGLIVANIDGLRANPGGDYIAWVISYSSAIQIGSMTAGTYNAHWQACDADESVTVSDIEVTAGTNSFSKPGGITSNEVVVWLERQ